MTASLPSRPSRARRSVSREDADGAVIAGVCAGLARRLGVNVLLVRLVFVATAVISGVGLVAYVLAWIVMPAAQRGQPRPRRGAIEVSFGAGLLLLSVLLGVRALGLPFSDVVIWPLSLVAAGGALIWRHSAGVPSLRLPLPARGGRTPAEPELPAKVSSDPVLISGIGVGVTLVIAAGIVFLQISGALAAATDVALAAIVVAVALGVIFAPWVLRLVKSLAFERAERIRSQERAEVAAHLHDSVLQTLALVQKQASDPRAVAALARRQERELRKWLNRGDEQGAGERRLAAALQDAAAEVEEAYGIDVDVVAVGDAPLDADGEALVAATREAMLNAAKFGAGAPVAVYAEATAERLEVFVRDRGPGFDPEAVPADRRGVRESIVGRMERHGGRAAINASPGGGTEVELVLTRIQP